MKNSHICEFPCDCPNPNDCSHECEDPCGAPALLYVSGTGRDPWWACLKHANYEAVCLERSAYNLRREIQAALDSVIDVDFKSDPKDGHTCDPREDADDCEMCKLAAKESLRLEREAIAEDEANESAPY
jgi:hypothetical protein